LWEIAVGKNLVSEFAGYEFEKVAARNVDFIQARRSSAFEKNHWLALTDCFRCALQGV
jgi:hypothetical protein